MNMEERESQTGEAPETGGLGYNILTRNMNTTRNKEVKGHTARTNRPETSRQEPKTKPTGEPEKQEYVFEKETITNKSRGNRFTIGMNQEGENNSTMLTELQRIDERNELKLLQKAIEESKERHKDNLQQTETSKNMDYIPEKNGIRPMCKNIPKIGTKSTDKKHHMVKIKKEEIEKSATNLYKFFTKNAREKEKKCKLPFYVSNDADLAGIAEVNLGAGKKQKGVVLVITIGTGIGSGLFYNGKLVPNLEVGKLLHKDGQIIEYFTADSIRKKENLSLEQWALRLNVLLEYIKTVFSPNLVILGGGISKKYDEFKKYLTTDVNVKISKFRNNAGIIGAAMYASKKLKK